MRGIWLCCLLLFISGCEKEKTAAPVVTQSALAVTVMKVVPQDSPVVFTFNGMVRSTHKVEIRARVEGFLEKRLYREGTMVEPGETLFQLDRKPFESALQQAQGELGLRQAQLEYAQSNLARVKPLAKKNAVSLKDLGIAISDQKSAAAALQKAEAGVRLAELNLGYTLIRTPGAGVVGKALVQEGSYVSPALNGLLTSVSQIDPILVAFKISENELLHVEQQVSNGLLVVPENRKFQVEVERSDGSLYPHQGQISFAEPVIDPKTGTYEVEARLDNPQRALRPGQFVRIRLKGAYRPKAVQVPQAVVTEGANGPFVWVVDQQQKAAVRALHLGEWHADKWFVDDGLKEGEQVVLDNISKLAPGRLLKAEAAVPQRTR
ncbi:efflux RND transporter periplasmic adaptor subunit [Desulfopila sp. IMCC35008]|uniref:efflux RND transporter periplasmic adaptor subunit n=1 Tax=Desulfopila sp. IMCC35008 TaxID=2653858 RepID=UPI0013D2E1A2|nr:efflux RND transporter periplasmic adaptor subunit [Desulfopila sp. IMCC35008]